jgi:hypothetical protein
VSLWGVLLVALQMLFLMLIVLLLLLLVLLLVMLLLRIPFFVLLICASVAADVLTAHCNSVGGKCTALSGPLSFDIYCSSCGRPFCPAACFQCTALPLLTWVARQLFQAAFASACQVCSCKAHAVSEDCPITAHLQCLLG